MELNPEISTGLLWGSIGLVVGGISGFSLGKGDEQKIILFNKLHDSFGAALIIELGILITINDLTMSMQATILPGFILGYGAGQEIRRRIQ